MGIIYLFLILGGLALYIGIVYLRNKLPGDFEVSKKWLANHDYEKEGDKE